MTTSRAGTARRTHPVRTAALVMAVVFVLAGVLGFIPGVTTDYEAMKFAGPESMAMLLGVFCVSILHNIVHLLFGVVGLTMARTVSGATAFLIGGGAVYAVLWIYGLLIDENSAANFVPVNSADNWLHLALAVVMLGLGLALRRAPSRRAA